MLKIDKRVIYLVRGDSASFDIADFETDYTKQNGDILTFTVKKDPDAITAYIKETASNGVFTIDAEDTETLPSGSYVYDIELKRGELVDTIIAPNVFKLIGDITRDNDIVISIDPDDYVSSVNNTTGAVKIKTINGNSLIGEGNIVIQGGSGGGSWGSIGGNIETQLDLMGKLNLKMNASELSNLATKTELTNATSPLSSSITRIDGEIDNTIIPAINGKQATLVSGTNIKTINGESIMGSGNLVIQGGQGAVQSVNGKTGNVVLDAEDVGALDEDTPLFSGDYNDLTNKPTLFSGDYNDLSNKPTIPTVPTNISSFINDAGYLTQHQSLSGYATQAWVTSQGYQNAAQVQALIDASLEEIEDGDY